MRSRSSKPVVWLLVVLLALSALCLALFTRGRSQKSSPDRAVPGEGVVALVNGQPITREAWQQLAARRGTDSGKAALADLIRQELLFQRACAAGYDRDPQLLASFRRMVAAKFEEQQLTNQAALAAASDEVRAYYNDHLENYRLPEKRHAAVLFVRVPRTASADKKKEQAERANAIRQEALTSRGTDRHFGSIAAKYSDDQTTRYTGGDLGWLARGEAVPRFGPLLTDALFALGEVGEVSPLIETPDSLCLIKLVEQRNAAVRPFDEVREQIAFQVTQQRRQQARREFDQQLRAGAEIQINDAAVAAAPVAAKVTEPKPPRMPSL